jgi:hypothetical protein
MLQCNALYKLKFAKKNYANIGINVNEAVS